MARPKGMTPNTKMKYRAAVNLLEQAAKKKETLNNVELHKRLKKAFKGSTLSGALIAQARRDAKNTPKLVQSMLNMEATMSGRMSSKKSNLANYPKTLPSIRLPKGVKVVDAGLKATWAAEKDKLQNVIGTPTKMPLELDDGLRKLLMMVREEMIKGDVCDLNLDEDGNLEFTIKQVSHVNTRLPDRVVTY